MDEGLEQTIRTLVADRGLAEVIEVVADIARENYYRARATGRAYNWPVIVEHLETTASMVERLEKGQGAPQRKY